MAPVAKLICIISAGLGIGRICGEEHQNPKITKELSTKSAYPIPKVQVGNGKCTLNQVHLLTRHGTRNPTSGSVDDLDELTALVANATTGVPKSIKAYKNLVTQEQAGQLVPQGVADLQGLALRDRQRYGNFTNLASDAVARADKSPRVEDTGRSYLTALYGNANLLKVLARGEPLLTPFDGCKKADDAKAAQKAIRKASFPDELGKTVEGAKFSKANIGAVVQHLQKSVPGIEWNTTRAGMAYDACQTEFSISGQGRWCDALGKEGLEIMSLHDDIDFNFRSGSQAPVPKLGCALLTDMVAQMDKAVAGNGAGITKMHLNFAHAETIGPFATTLGLFIDKSILNGATTATSVAGRQFRGSKVAPFMANFHVELWTCGSTPTVRVLHNEIAVALPACGGKTECPLAEFKVAFKDQLGCDTVKLCGGKSLPDDSSSD